MYTYQSLSIKFLNAIQLIEIFVYTTKDIDEVIHGTAAMTKSFLIELGSNLPFISSDIIFLNASLANEIIKPLIIIVIVAAT